jgi:hypothetical protein
MASILCEALQTVTPQHHGDAMLATHILCTWLGYNLIFVILLDKQLDDHGCVCVPCSEAYSSVLYRTFSDQSFVAQVDSIKAFQHGGTCSKIVFFWNLLFQSTCHYSEEQHFLCFTLMSGQLDDSDLVGLLGLSLSGLV